MLTLKNWKFHGDRVHGTLGKAHVITSKVKGALPRRDGTMVVLTANAEYHLC